VAEGFLSTFLASYPPAIILAAALMFVAGGIINGALGFGLPLVTISVLPLIMPVEVALAVNAVTTPFNNYSQLRRGGDLVPIFRRFRPIIVTTVIGIVAGALIVSYVNETALLVSLGVFVVFFTMVSLAAPRIAVPPSREWSLGVFTGLVGGVFAALTTASGPIYIMYFVGLAIDRVTFVAVLGLIFIVTGIVLCASFLLLGLIDLPVLLLSIVCIPAAQIGMNIGFWIAGKVSAQRFRTFVLIALAILGANLVAQGIGS
jgi:uncharacterized protein